jgi:penicillin-binding protein 1A
LPTVAWQKFMAYAHTNIEIKPVAGIEFEPVQTVVAVAEDATVEPQVERPPGLKPEAAKRLLDVADLLRDTLRTLQPTGGQALLTPEAPEIPPARASL